MSLQVALLLNLTAMGFHSVLPPPISQPKLAPFLPGPGLRLTSYPEQSVGGMGLRLAGTSGILSSNAMKRLPLPAKALLVLALIWGVASGLMWLAGYWKITPEKISASIRANPLEDASGRARIESAAVAAKRLEFINEVAGKVQKLNHAQRRKLRQDPDAQNFYRRLSDEEKAHFVKATLPSGFEEFMKALNSMDRDERRKFVEKSIVEMEENNDDEELDRLTERDPELINSLIEEGMKAYYNEASAATKLDLAPLMEEMQRRAQQME